MANRYAVGVDYGSLSARALLLNLDTGEEAAVSEFAYPHAVMDTALPDGTPLGTDWALQHPQDYLDALHHTLPDLLHKAGASPDEVVGIGIDFTSCTILPTTKEGIPLCFLPEYKGEPHAYVKLWKHHAAQYCADLLNETAEQRGEPWLSLYGGRISSEWVVPKAMQIAKEAPAVYDAAGRILEAGDWVVWQLCGEEVRSACNAGYKALWHHQNGYPSEAFFEALDPRMKHFVRDKLAAPDGTDRNIRPLGSRAGFLTREAAALTGLNEGTAVAVEIIDAHASVPGSGINAAGQMLMIMGTSTCHMLLSETEEGVPGTCGIVKDGILPGFYGYEAGQSCVGDHFAWFVENGVPAAYRDEAKERGMNIHALLREKAGRLKPGESGLVALDWWNGVRSVLMDFDLSGLIVGMTLQTKPEAIYRALIEATAFGTRRIIEAFEDKGVPVRELYAAGGIALKDPMMMQIYADVCNREIRLSGSTQSGALGSAIFGAAAAGPELSGFADVGEAVRKLGRLHETVYRPVPAHVDAYERLYGEYRRLHDFFGLEEGTMKRLKQMKKEAKG